MNENHKLERILTDIGCEPVPPDVHQLAERITDEFRRGLAEQAEVSGPAQPAVRLVPDVPTDQADGVSREVHPIEQPPGRRHVSRRFLAMFQKKAVRWSFVAAAAAAVVLAVGLWPGKPGRSGTGNVFAACLQQLRGGSYTFDLDVRTSDGGEASLKGAVLEPGRLRLEEHGGLGSVASITDLDTKQSLVLFNRFKAAYRFDSEEEPEVGSLGFLVMPGRSIVDLWSLRAGDETSLGTRLVDGKPAEGFRVIREQSGDTETITVWADRRTGYPLKVEVVLQSGSQSKPPMEHTLKNFTTVAAPDPALFSTEVPEGFTLANQTTLEQLLSQADRPPDGAGASSPEAEKILRALELVAGGDKKAAAEVVRTVDWNGDMRFAPNHWTFTMTEKQYIGLVTADQEKVTKQVMSQCGNCRTLGRELVDLGRQTRMAKDTAGAEQYLQAAVHFGEILNNRADGMLVVRLVGIAIQQLALNEMLVVYVESGQFEKAEKVRGQLGALADQHAKIKAGVTGK